ncbi:hypothetical protein LXL04_004712 [Taraxacum kok-saghyz]
MIQHPLKGVFGVRPPLKAFFHQKTKIPSICYRRLQRPARRLLDSSPFFTATPIVFLPPLPLSLGAIDYSFFTVITLEFFFHRNRLLEIGSLFNCNLSPNLATVTIHRLQASVRFCLAAISNLNLVPFLALSTDDDNHDGLEDMLHDVEDNVAEKDYETFQQLFVDSEKPVYPGYNEMPISLYQAKKLLCPMGMEIERIHACPNDCILYRNEYVDLHECVTCGTSQYKRKNDAEKNEDVTKSGPPAKLLRYFPIIPRLKRLFANAKDAKLLRWHAEEHDTWSLWLSKCKKNVYMGHRRSLPRNHLYRTQKDLFEGKIEKGVTRPRKNWEAVFSRVKDVNIVFGKSSKNMPSYIRKKRSISWELPYWKHLEVRHCLDVMHIEKNVCESLIGLLLNIPNKTKDEINARKDMVEMGIRPQLAPVENDRKRTYLPPTCYTMSKDEKTKFCRCLHNVKVPSGFSANIKKLVSMKDLKFIDMKSHDCHVLITQMIPIAICVINPEVLDSWQNDIILTLCQLKMYFPPSFFDVMVHLISHIVSEIKAYGPIFLHYMYPFESHMGILKGYVRNYHRPEGSIIEGYASEEVIGFCTDYLKGVTIIGIPQSRHEGRLGGVGTLGLKMVVPTIEEFNMAHLTVLEHMAVIAPYINAHKTIMLHSMLETRGGDKVNNCAFISPTEIQAPLCKSNGGGVISYLVDTMSFHQDKQFFIAPYWQGAVAMVKESSDTTYPMTWTFVRCNQQPSGWECGYYVLRWMFEFVLNRQNEFPNKITGRNVGLDKVGVLMFELDIVYLKSSSI